MTTDNNHSHSEQEPTPLKTVLYDKHTQLAEKSHIVPFAGYLMPLWYSSIAQEHQAVRKTAGMFDCTHMGVWEISGPQAEEFLQQITVNNVAKLTPGRAQYSYVVNTDGHVHDDIIIYKRKDELFMVVVNAANNDKVAKWWQDILAGNVVIDNADTNRKITARPVIRDMRDTNSGNDCRVDIAIQGPASADIIKAMLDDNTAANKMDELKPFGFIEATISGISVIVSRTGYTGAKVGFEIYVHPGKAGMIWDITLEKGKAAGLLPCGLGARDSLRIEAGLPLYGHELAGEYDISPYEAGYGWAVKLDKEFFIGQAALKEKSQNYDHEVVRMELPGKKGIRPVRSGDGILDDTGSCLGWVLSNTKVGDTQIVLAYVKRGSLEENQPTGVYYLARNQGQVAKGKKQKVDINEKLQADITGKVVSRFARF